MTQEVTQIQKKTYSKKLRSNPYLSKKKSYLDCRYLRIEKLKLINGLKLKSHITKISFLMKMFYQALRNK